MERNILQGVGVKKHTGIQLSYDIQLEKGTCKPTSVRFWSSENQKAFKPEAPFKYMADALVGLSLFKLNSYIKSPVLRPEYSYEKITEAWSQLDPHHHIFDRSNDRLSSIHSNPKATPHEVYAQFEQAFLNAFESIQKPWGLDLSDVGPLLDTVSWLEEKTGEALLFNMDYQWSRPFREKLFSLYSFLHNLRSVVAIDINAHIEDPSHEAVKVDAITDYLPRAEYVVNDALLYWNFKKITQPWAHKAKSPKPDSQVDTLLVEPLDKAFHKFSHNAVRLVKNLPSRFMESLSPVEMEEALYLVQMDWLLGSDAGLLFRIREELFGIQNGYEEIFWQDLDNCSHRKVHKLSICCHIDDNTLTTTKVA